MACALAGGIATLAAANDETSSAEQTLTYLYPLAPGSAILGFDQFDDHGGTRVLLEVQIEVDGAMQADITAENDTDLPAPDLSLGLTGVFVLDFEQLGVSDGFSEQFPTDGVGRSDGIPGSGPDFWDFGTVVLPTLALDSTTTDLDVFIGPDTVDAVVFATGGFSLSGASDTTLTVSNYLATGSVTVTYFFKRLPGACCFDDGSCSVGTETECTDAGGVYQGDGTACNPCPQPGACCLPDGTCDERLESACVEAGGLFQGEGSLCVDIACPGACCLDDGSCQFVTAAACDGLGGVYQGDGV
ncbi:MAG: choice-of-anchor E domain-containing protein, partial [Phycisphaerae bacterium]|nr:choice-of-anchor E domain-containing protein [Phycisphaerae bacterium]